VVHFSPASSYPINSAHSQAPNLRPYIHHVVINFNYPNIAELKKNIAFLNSTDFYPKIRLQILTAVRVYPDCDTAYMAEMDKIQALRKAEVVANLPQNHSVVLNVN
jgi:hypothetical protein